MFQVQVVMMSKTKLLNQDKCLKDLQVQRELLLWKKLLMICQDQETMIKDQLLEMGKHSQFKGDQMLSTMIFQVQGLTIMKSKIS